MTEVYLVEYAPENPNGPSIETWLVGVYSTYDKAFEALKKDAARNSLAELDMSNADMDIFGLNAKNTNPDAIGAVIGSYGITIATIDAED